MKKIHETLFILHKCDLNLKLVNEAINEHQQKGPLFSVHHFTKNLTHYIILESLSFIEEYRKNFVEHEVEQEYGTRVLMVRSICKPIFKQINKWKDLQKFRDNFIAHLWRNSKKFVVPLSNSYHIPRTWIEFQFLKDLVHYIYEIIEAEFTLEMDEAMFYGNNLNEQVPSLYTIDEINKDVQILGKRVATIMKSYKKDYKFDIYHYQK